MSVQVITAVVLLSADTSPLAAQRDFTELGFSVQLVGSNTLLISATPALFESRFACTLKLATDGSVALVDSNTSPRTLPLAQLPESVRIYVIAVEFEQPIDFRPATD